MTVTTERYRALPQFLVALAVLVTLAGTIALVYVRRRLVAAAGESVQLAAVDIAAALDLAMFDRFREVLAAARSSRLRPGEGGDVAGELAALREGDPLYLWLGVSDASGEVIAATTPASLGAMWDARPWFRAIRGGVDSEVHDATTSIAIAAALRDDHGGFAGVLSAHIGLGALQRTWLRTVYALRDRWGTWIDWRFITPTGEVIDGDLRRWHPDSFPLELARAFAGGSAAESGYFEGMADDAPRAVISGFARTRGFLDYTGLDWTVLVRVDRAKILAPVDRVVRALAVLGVLVVGPIFGLLVWGVRRLRSEWVEARDATARAVSAEAAERARQEQIRAIVETASDAIITMDPHGRIASVNLAGARMFGCPAGDLVGTDIGALVPGLLDGEMTHGGRPSPLAARGGNRGRDITARRKDGSEFPVELGMSEIVLDDRRVVTAIVRDISARRQAELETRDRQAMLAHALRVSTLGEMAAGLAHELHQPLTAIAGYALAGSEEARMAASGSPQFVELLGKIEAEAQRAGAIIRRLREFIRKAEPRLELCELSDRIHNAVGLLEGELQRHGVTVHCELEAGLKLYADPVQIEQVLVNLVQNAIDAIVEAGHEEKRIVIESGRRADGVVEVDIRDSGGGVSDLVAARMFDAFFTTKPTGLGMGLAISRAIVESHHGRLSAVRNVDGGLTVRLILPERGDGVADVP